jgi:hypothetical protein
MLPVNDAMQPWQPQQHQQPPAWNPPPLPGAIAPKSADEHDLAALSPFMPKVAASLAAVGGLCAALGALQTWMTVDILDDAWYFVPIINAIFGVAAIACAVRLASARRWASIAVLVLSSVLTLTSGAWCVYALMNHLFAVFIVLAPPMCLVGTALTAVSIASCDRAERARARLAAQGLELGL